MYCSLCQARLSVMALPTQPTQLQEIEAAGMAVGDVEATLEHDDAADAQAAVA